MAWPGEDFEEYNAYVDGLYSSFSPKQSDIAYPGYDLNHHYLYKPIKFQIDDGWAGLVSVSIYNLSGRQVHKSKHTKASGAQLIVQNVNHLPEGAYMLLVSTDEHTYATKFIVLKR